jgi:Fe-S cluster biogenesis protein NfuA
VPAGVIPRYDEAMQTTAAIEAGNDLHQRVGRVLNLIRPVIQADGGDLELVEVTGQGVVRIRLHGACVGCPSSSMTLQLGIERNLKEHVPEVRSVEAVA